MKSRTIVILVLTTLCYQQASGAVNFYDWLERNSYLCESGLNQVVFLNFEESVQNECESLCGNPAVTKLACGRDPFDVETTTPRCFGIDQWCLEGFELEVANFGSKTTMAPIVQPVETATQEFRGLVMMNSEDLDASNVDSTVKTNTQERTDTTVPTAQQDVSIATDRLEVTQATDASVNVQPTEITDKVVGQATGITDDVATEPSESTTTEAFKTQEVVSTTNQATTTTSTTTTTSATTTTTSTTTTPISTTTTTTTTETTLVQRTEEALSTTEVPLITDERAQKAFANAFRTRLLSSESPGCFDGDTACSFWSNTGECEKNPRYMNLVCRKACGRCIPLDSNDLRKRT
ncbi:unnamed protein product [Bursaphelenchus okinawaensis]|uniref:ShKT domain-containing protein n=1 Tax=Bursaphelenchus okinawaensis TaxID=465554 RepID=A0A811KBM7_9BILA|nr:unnamed protein product [Bursaphelenchus okinawaensis]CAG9099469.1 unnamed protein product [Bursaphelenchus okinawaensis]